MKLLFPVSWKLLFSPPMKLLFTVPWKLLLSALMKLLFTFPWKLLIYTHIKLLLLFSVPWKLPSTVTRVLFFIASTEPATPYRLTALFFSVLLNYTQDGTIFLAAVTENCNCIPWSLPYTVVRHR
jgi:hypothetical protein